MKRREFISLLGGAAARRRGRRSPLRSRAVRNRSWALLQVLVIKKCCRLPRRFVRE